MHGIKDNMRYLNHLILSVCLVGAVLSFQKYIQYRYRQIITTPQLIEDFKRSTVQDLPSLKKKYDIDYMRIRENHIIENPSMYLPRIDLISVALVKSPAVMTINIRDSLLQTRPYVFIDSFSLYILFPLVFPEKKDTLLIIKKILP